DGIWDGVRRPTKQEVVMVHRLAKKFDPRAWLREGGVAKFKYDLPKTELLLRYLYEPTVNICGIHSGYVDHGGTKTVLPHEAHGKEPEVWPSSGGTMPAFAFDEYLHLPWVATGLGHGAHAHAPNEYASIDGMRRFIAGEASLVYAAARRLRPRAT